MNAQEVQSGMLLYLTLLAIGIAIENLVSLHCMVSLYALSSKVHGYLTNTSTNTFSMVSDETSCFNLANHIDAESVLLSVVYQDVLPRLRHDVHGLLHACLIRKHLLADYLN